MAKAWIDNTQIAYTLASATDQNFIKSYLNKIVWQFFRENENDVVAEIKLWLWTKKVYVRDLRPLFVRFVGEPQV